MSEQYSMVPPEGSVLYRPEKIYTPKRYERFMDAVLCAGILTMPTAMPPQPVEQIETVAVSNISLPPQFLDECPDVSDDTLAKVDALIATPGDPGAFKPALRSPSYDYPYLMTIDESFPPEASYQPERYKQWEAKAAMARRTGLELYNPAVHTNHLRPPLDNPFLPPLPFEDYTDAADTFGRQIGIDIRMAAATDTGLNEINFYLHSPQNQGADVRQAIVDTIDYLGGFTAEYLELSGVKEIVLYDTRDTPAVGIAVSGDIRQIALRANGPVTEPILAHELYHHIAQRICGGTYKDAQFDAPGHDTYSIDDYEKATWTLISKRTEAYGQRDYATVCRLHNELLAVADLVGAFSDYGKLSSAENKAVMAAMLGERKLFWMALSSMASETLRMRTRLALGQLYDANPSLAQYYIGLMPRVEVNDLVLQACQSGDFSLFKNSNSSNNGQR